jgi:hypothetical protein
MLDCFEVSPIVHQVRNIVFRYSILGKLSVVVLCEMFESRENEIQ